MPIKSSLAGISRHDLWAVVPYQNPCQYESRLRNFRTFREKLGIPLLVVEISRTGDFQLKRQDADILLQIVAEDRLWQKERLVNIGVANLPDNAAYVAWLDCDIVFENSDWSREAASQLRHGFDLVQPFKSVVHQTRNDQTVFPASFDFMRPDCELGAGYAVVNKKFTFNGGERATYSPGHAWCSRKDRIASYPLYDRMISGSGDTIHLASALGLLESCLQIFPLSSPHLEDIRKHYRQAGLQRVSYVENTIFHLYHGTFNNRNYLQRHQLMKEFGFDPDVHLVLNPRLPLQLTAKGAMISAILGEYFNSRREDD